MSDALSTTPTKMCPHCERDLPTTSFYPHKSGGSGLQGWCKSCANESRRAAYVKRANSEKQIPEQKRCTQCQLVKTSSEFSRHRGNTDGLHCECKVCHKRYVDANKERTKGTRLLREYGISMDDYRIMLSIQENKCDGCRRQFSHHPHVDHAHDETKRVRGLLCHDCNMALGLLRDNPETLKRLAWYLENQLPLVTESA